MLVYKSFVLLLLLSNYKLCLSPPLKTSSFGFASLRPSTLKFQLSFAIAHRGNLEVREYNIVIFNQPPIFWIKTEGSKGLTSAVLTRFARCAPRPSLRSGNITRIRQNFRKPKRKKKIKLNFH